MRAVRFEVNEARNEVFLNGKAVCLTPRTYRILLALWAGRSRTLTRRNILDRAWDSDSGFDLQTRTVDQHVSRLRRALDRAAGRQVRLIETVPGYGYRWAEH
jgi:two-component system phosphate regulon response regulator PhoB